VKLVIIASRFPYPLEKGDKLRLFYQIKSLSKEFEIYLCSLTDIPIEKASYKALEKYCKEIHVFKIHGKKNAFKGLLNKKPFQVNYFYDRSVHKQMNVLVERIAPDHIFYQLLRTTEYSFNARYSKSVDMMDCFSKGYKLRGFKEKGLRKRFYKAEAHRLIAYEDSIIDTFTHKYIISKQDKNALLKRRKTEFHVLSNGIDTEYFNPIKQKQKYDIVFVGNMGYEPNIYAVRYIIEELLPKFDDRATILIAGARPPAQLKAKANSRITISGWLEDIRDAYNESKLFLAPIRDGIGQQNKILEAMAMELPCVVSKEVAEGLDIPEVEKYLFIADSKEEYIAYVKNILDQTVDTSQRIGLARGYVLDHRSWEAVNKKLTSTISSIVSGGKSVV